MPHPSIEINTQHFIEAAKREARRARVRSMRQVNAERETIRELGIVEGAEYVRHSEDNFRVPCYVCGELMRFSSRDLNWDRKRAILYGAFRNWRHTSCHKAPKNSGRS